jgi:hypothetical protein
MTMTLENENIERDDKGHAYAEVGNIRITYIPLSGRNPEADWAGADVIRIQSYKSSNNKSLHMGAEVPIFSNKSFGEFIAALCSAYIRGGAEKQPSKIHK